MKLPASYEDTWRELYAEIAERHPDLEHDEVLARATERLLDELWEDDVLSDELLWHSYVDMDIDDIKITEHDVRFADEAPIFQCDGQQAFGV